ncbi:MAG: hypothetical protein AAB316_15995 [Bacteroidota bacterium]
MRIIGSIPHPTLKITVFKMDNRLSIKFEAGMYEQTYKFRESTDLQDFAGAQRLVDEPFLRFVLELASKMADEVGCGAVVVDAKPGAVDFYAKYGFAPFEPLEGQSDARPQPTAMYLIMQDIKAAAEHAH